VVKLASRGPLEAEFLNRTQTGQLNLKL
jgi:hypothetical protein